MWEVVLHTYAEDDAGRLDDVYEVALADATKEEAEKYASKLRHQYPRCGAFARPKEEAGG